ncbi:MAG: hypothetical protein ABIO72_00070 [Patescibacteria group bacterium]
MKISFASRSFAVIALAAAILSLPTVAAYAAEPTTKCITATSKTKRVAAVDRLEKDVAPYAKNEKSAAAVQAYRDTLEVAWSALEQPYCGYGKEGPASAIKSFGKSADRARLAFLDSVKNHAPVKTVLSVAKEDSEETTTPDGPTPSIDKMMKTPTPVAVAVKTTKAGSIKAGFRRGMRASTVSDIQTRLAKHFNVAKEDLVTGYFGPKTESFIIKLQLEKKIIKSSADAAAGLVGPKTAAALNTL